MCEPPCNAAVCVLLLIASFPGPHAAFGCTKEHDALQATGGAWEQGYAAHLPWLSGKSIWWHCAEASTEGSLEVIPAHFMCTCANMMYKI